MGSSISSQTITAATNNLNSENRKRNGDWTVDVPHRGKQRKMNNPKIEVTEQAAAWVPSDTETDPERESKLIHKIQICIKKLEKSDFYQTFLHQIQTPQILNYFTCVLASEPKMQMVIYGIGSIDSCEPPRLQLVLAILIKRSFDWIGDIEVFDPVLSKTESRVLEALGCSVLLVNEHGRRQVSKPTMFFMPHCDAILYDNLLQANWQAEFLNRMVVFGNSFEKYAKIMAKIKISVSRDHRLYHVLAVRRFSIEVGIEVADDFFRTFRNSCWHFFSLDPEMDLELKS